MLEEAHEIYAALQQWLRERLLAMPARLDPVVDAGLIDERDRLRSRYVEVQLLKTGILQKKADTLPTGSPEYREVLRAAAADNAAVSSITMKWRGPSSRPTGAARNASGIGNGVPSKVRIPTANATASSVRARRPSGP